MCNIRGAGGSGVRQSLAWGNARNNFLACDMYLLRATIGHSLSQHAVFFAYGNVCHNTHLHSVPVTFLLPNILCRQQLTRITHHPSDRSPLERCGPLRPGTRNVEPSLGAVHRQGFDAAAVRAASATSLFFLGFSTMWLTFAFLYLRLDVCRGSMKTYITSLC